MRPDVFYLLVDGWLGNFAFLDVLDQSAVPSHKADIEFLFRLVPLAANHDAIAVAVGLGTRYDGRHHLAGDFPDALEQVGDLLVLDLELGGVRDVLVLATAAAAEVRAGRRHAVRRWLEDADEFGASEVFFDLGDLGFDFLAHQDERNEHDKFLEARDSFAAEGDIADLQGCFLAGD